VFLFIDAFPPPIRSVFLHSRQSSVRFNLGPILSLSWSASLSCVYQWIPFLAVCPHILRVSVTAGAEVLLLGLSGFMGQEESPVKGTPKSIVFLRKDKKGLSQNPISSRPAVAVDSETRLELFSLFKIRLSPISLLLISWGD